LKPILEINNIWKSYKIGGQKERYLSLRDKLMNPFKSTPKEEFWALKDISFTVEQGESVGIIGRNGAGKSTLLKILSRITPPTKGFIKARGRVASLLEVGTGFHPELTGRENIYLNGSILGLKRQEIKARYDEIVAFAGVEKFLNTPLKRYSSGMELRLAFAVAAFLDADLLILDEILAVGDQDFQNKCLAKMDNITQATERSIILISHNMDAIRRVCSKSLLLEKGKVKAIGPTEEIISLYTNSQ